MIRGFVRWLLWVFGVRDERTICDGCGRAMWRAPEMSPQEKFAMGDITLEELERIVQGGKA